MINHSKIARSRTRGDTATIVQLFDIEPPSGERLRLTGDTSVALGFGGEVYAAVPIEVEGFAWQSHGNPARPQIRIANSGAMFAKHLTAPFLVGSRVKRIVTFLEECDAPHGTGGGACFTPESWKVERITRADADEITLTLMPEASLDGRSLPLKVMLKDLCQHRYRIWDSVNNRFDYSRATCPYVGNKTFDASGAATKDKSKDKCSLRLESGCKKRFSGVLPYLGFPGLGEF